MTRTMTLVRSLLLGLAATALVFAACDDDGDDGEAPAAGDPFYIEATITVVSHADTVGTNLPTPEGDGETHVTEVRWWNRDATHARWELAGYTGVLDGQDLWLYDEAANTYVRGPIPDLPEGTVSAGIPGVSVLLGPTNTPDLAGFIAYLESELFVQVTIAGSGTLLGREVTIVEAGPASMSSTDGGPEVGHGVVRMFVDEATMLILRYEIADDPVQNVDAVVTRLDQPADIPDSVVSFDPPANATDTTPD